MNRLRQITFQLLRGCSYLNTSGSLVALFILLILALFLVELPPWLLDILLVTNLMFSLILLLRGIFIDSPLKLFSFPTILVLTTLLRLALNVSSAKLILLHGHQGLDSAGQVIKSFGNFVVQGDFIVGVIIFGIIAVVNFVVVAKGSARVAEVAARFALDALPGRQLSIDAELRAGTLSKEEASIRRDDLNRESRFFGAMDGAMKWVQGDAVAGLVIAFINAVGGVGLGISRGMDISDAVNTFGILTVGDGLVTILPSLLVSLAAGVIVSHVGGRERRGSGDQLFSQLVSDPRPLLITSFAFLLMGALALAGVWAFPALPFFIVGGALLLFFITARPLVWDMAFVEAGPLRLAGGGSRAQFSGSGAPALEMPAQFHGMSGTPLLDSPDDVSILQLDVDARLLAPLLGVVRENGAPELGGAQFHTAVEQVRLQVLRMRGYLLTPIGLSVDSSLQRGGYRVRIRDQVSRTGIVPPGAVLAVANNALLALFEVAPGSSSRHPMNHRPAVWIPAHDPGIASLEVLGVEIISPLHFVVYSVIGAALEVLDELFGVDEAKTLVASLQPQHEHLIAEVFDGKVLNYAEFAELLRRLMRERVNIRDLKLILEGIAEFSALHPAGGDERLDWLSELHAFLRVVLSRSIFNDAMGPGERLRTFVLSPDIEDEFRLAASRWQGPRARVPLAPDFENSLRVNALKMFNPVLDRGALPIVLLCADDVRAAVQEFFGRQMTNSEWIRTIAYQELIGPSQPDWVGVLSISG